jgi:2-desacetyl-2-hydroxyethyl bacteriochlorophyllide A dehydrogenase
MKAGVLVAPKRIEIVDVPNPVPGDGEVLIRIRQAGICGTDYALFSGHLPVSYPIIPGHEGVGEIAALGPNARRFSVGDRVTLQPNFPCGACPLCRSGRGNVCRDKVRLGLDIHGVFAEYVSIPQEYVWRLPEDLPYSTAVFTEPLAVAVHGLRKSPPSPGESVLVYGTGVIGLLWVQLALLAKGSVTAFDTAVPRLDLAKDLGAGRVISSIDNLLKERSSFSVIYETSGAPEAFGHSVELSAPGGRIVLAGLPPGDSGVSTSQIVRRELIVMGSIIYNDEFPEALKLLHGGDMKVQALTSGTYPLEKTFQAFEEFRSPHRVKTVILVP